MIRVAQPRDVSRLCEIYNHYVRETIVSFETDPVSETDMLGRLREICAGHAWLVV
jgi:L-amino acid N-acyltransferase YncA